jgi:predicted RNA-binding protein YlxR (DUF448 family)
MDCFEAAIRRRAFERALRAPVASPITDDEIEKMRARLGQ